MSAVISNNCAQGKTPIVVAQKSFALDCTKYFNYLEELRESGAINMWGAPAYLQDIFGLSKGDASHIFNRWINER